MHNCVSQPRWNQKTELKGFVVPHPFPTSDSLMQWFPYATSVQTLETATTGLLLVAVAYFDVGPRVMPGALAMTMCAITLAYAAIPFCVYIYRSQSCTIKERCVDQHGRILPGSIHCFGLQSEIQRIAEHAFPVDREPVVIPRLMSKDPAGTWVVLHSVITCTATWYISRVFPQAWVIGYFLIMTSVPLARIVAAGLYQMRPIYYRVSPGLIEVIRGRMWNAGTYIMKRVSLVGAALIIRFDEQYIVIAHNPGSGEETRISLQGIIERHRMAESLAWAISIGCRNRNSTELPEDSLLG